MVDCEGEIEMKTIESNDGMPMKEQTAVEKIVEAVLDDGPVGWSDGYHKLLSEAIYELDERLKKLEEK